MGEGIVAGIWPLVSLRNAEFLANEVPGVVVPPAIIERMGAARQEVEGGGSLRGNRDRARDARAGETARAGGSGVGAIWKSGIGVGGFPQYPYAAPSIDGTKHRPTWNIRGMKRIAKPTG